MPGKHTPSNGSNENNPDEPFDFPPHITPDGRTAEEVLQDQERDKRMQEAVEWERTRRAATERVALELAEQRETMRAGVLAPFSEIPTKDTYWLWDNRIPMGEITLLVGRGGIGKSLFLALLAARVTRGELEGESFGVPMNCIYIANEDSYEKTVKPRLLAAGADPKRVFRYQVAIHDGKGDWENTSLRLPLDCDRLGEAVERVGARAVFVDPLSSNMTDKDRNSPEVRLSYERLHKFAEEYDVALIGNGHVRKGNSADMFEAIMGSSEIGNVARAVMGMVRNPNAEGHEVILSQCKTNLGPSDLPNLTFTPQQTTFTNERGQTKWAVRLVQGEDSEAHVDDILHEVATGGIDTKSARQEARDFIRHYLTDKQGSAPRQEALRTGKAEGHSERTLLRAASDLKLKSSHGGGPKGTLWSLPAGNG